MWPPARPCLVRHATRTLQPRLHRGDPACAIRPSPGESRTRALAVQAKTRSTSSCPAARALAYRPTQRSDLCSRPAHGQYVPLLELPAGADISAPYCRFEISSRRPLYLLMAYFWYAASTCWNAVCASMMQALLASSAGCIPDRAPRAVETTALYPSAPTLGNRASRPRPVVASTLAGRRRSQSQSPL